MKPKVFIARPIPKQVEDYIAEYCEVERWGKEEMISRDQLFEKIREVDGLLISDGKIDAELLDHAPRLKVVSNVSVGYNNFDLEAMKSRNVMGTHTPFVLDETVADLVFSLMLAVARRIPELDRYVKEGKWQKGDPSHLFGIDVHHATIGIIGMGRIGEAVAKRAKYGFNMDVLYYNRRPKREVEKSLGIRYAAKEELLREADFVILMTPLTPETTNLMGETEFRLMKKNAIFVNASRGKAVDEQALIKALEAKAIYGAGLDVFHQEPVSPDNPLLKMENVVALPHIASATEKTQFNMAMIAAKNLVKAVKGEIPSNLVEELKVLVKVE
ncbi:2-hydroxyacid dehydrogenase [Bacillus sp. OTU530]|uniref:2-hydroxyacid dehydrogenase n=1 Tax=Bacillus sp. OTU530 TaxID=3043862 RepID=UPI00313EEC43